MALRRAIQRLFCCTSDAALPVLDARAPIALARRRPAKLSDIYSVKEEIGRGSSCVVKRCVEKRTGQEYAVKVLSKKMLDKEDLEVFRREIRILEKLRHPNIVNLIDCYESESKLCVVMELLQGGQLFDRIIQKGSYSESTAAETIRQIASGVEYLHSMGVVHRDLKPENLIYQHKHDTSNIKIADFGLAAVICPEKMSSSPPSPSPPPPTVADCVLRTACGTPAYICPEMLEGKPYGTSADMWSLGVVLYILLSGRPPFPMDDERYLYSLIRKGAYSFPDRYWKKVSPEAIDLVRRLMNLDPQRRLTASQVLSHSWTMGSALSRTLGDEHILRLKQTMIARQSLLRKSVMMVRAAKRFQSICSDSQFALL